MYHVELKSKDPSGPVPEWHEKYVEPSNKWEYTPGGGEWLFRCRATNNAGVGEWSDILEVRI